MMGWRQHRVGRVVASMKQRWLTMHGLFAWKALVQVLGHCVLVEAKWQKALAVDVREGKVARCDSSIGGFGGSKRRYRCRLAQG
jgi:hypothetical protein